MLGETKQNEKKTLATIWSHLMFGVLLCAAFASAQSFESIDLNGMQPPKVEIRYPEETTREGSLVSVRITIPDGWHVNANIVADDFLKPSTLNIQARGIQFGDPIWPEPIKEYSEALDLENLVFKVTVHIGYE